MQFNVHFKIVEKKNTKLNRALRPGDANEMHNKFEENKCIKQKLKSLWKGEKYGRVAYTRSFATNNYDGESVLVNKTIIKMNTVLN